MTEKLTKDQAVIISGFTGILCGEFSDFHADVEKRLGRGVQTFEFGFKEFMAEVKKLYEADFIKIGTVDTEATKAQAVPEGYVLVPKEKISYFWQDNDEPENFCSNESDFDCLGDCIDLGEIIEINKFTQAHVNKEKLFGTWFAEAIDPSEKANFFVGTHAECLEIVAKNKAMIEAQEQKG